MKKEISSPPIFLPCLHEQFVFEPLPPEVCFLDPGLAGQDLAGQNLAEQNLAGKANVAKAPLPPKQKIFTSDKLVYDPKEARLCLQELIRFEDEMQGSGQALALRILEEFWGELSPVENEDLQSFVASQAEGAGQEDGVNTQHAGLSIARLRREMYEQAQKNLLLAWCQEDNILSIARLLAEAGMSSNALEEALHDPLAGPDRAGEAGEDVSSQLPSKTPVIENVLQQNAAAKANLLDDMKALMLESGLSERDLEPKWSALLIGALCLTSAQTCFYTTANFLRDLLLELYGESVDLEAKLSGLRDLPTAEAQNLFPESVQKGWRFKIVEVSYADLLACYSSALLRRLLWLEGPEREHVRLLLGQKDGQ